MRWWWLLVSGLSLLGVIALAIVLRVGRARRAASRLTPEEEERVQQRLRDLP